MHIVEASPEYLALLFAPCDRPRRLTITEAGPVWEEPGYWIRHRNGVPPFEPQGFAVGASLPAEVFEGQWIVRCDTCRNSQFTSRADKRFFCVNCLNGEHGNQWRRVVWPRKDADIESILLCRRRFEHRNYEKGETVASLVADNRENRDLVPEEML
jgi:hypothetical protein